MMTDNTSEPSKETIDEGEDSQVSTDSTPDAAEHKNHDSSARQGGWFSALASKPVSVLAALALASSGGAVTAAYFTGEQRDKIERYDSNSIGEKQAMEAAKVIVVDMFTFDFADVEENLTAVLPRLTAPIDDEFRNKTMPTVIGSAQETQSNVFATVSGIGRLSYSPQEAKYLIMLNRKISTSEKRSAQDTGSRLIVTMKNIDGGWKLSSLDSL